MTLETGRQGFENGPSVPNYPRELVEKYGAKAGILMYVAEKLPDIPQVPMVVSEIGESAGSLLARADAKKIGWPRLFRSSAEAELLGYEGVFRTEKIDSFEVGHERVRWNSNNYSIYRNKEYFENGIRRSIDNIKDSPLWMKERGEGEGLPDEINVIVAEHSKSGFIGTYIKHPNKDGLFLIATSVAWTTDTNDADRTNFSYTKDEGIKEMEYYSIHHVGGEELEEQLAEVASWHDKIASLPDMDPSWSWQIEFGVQDPYLFQVRPFKPMQKSTFTLKPDPSEEYMDKPVVIGTTARQGLTLTAVDENSEKSDEDCVYVGKLRGAWKAEDQPNLKANILTSSYGFLQHNDIKVMRMAQVNVLVAGPSLDTKITAGDKIRIISDGERAQIKNLSKKS